MKKLFFALLSIILITSTAVKGQDETKQIGLRTGYRGGVFYQVTNESGNASAGFNFLLSFSNHGLQATGLRIVYESFFGDISPDLFFSWGYGGHIGFTYTDHLRSFGENYIFPGDRFRPLLGADGWLSAEYRFREIPLNISLNIKPFVEFTTPSFVRLMPVDIGLSVSYVF